jgi:hypothetical protein
MSKKKSTADLPPDRLTVSRHPRARASIRRVRAWSGLGAMFLVIFLSMRAGVPAADAWLRGLLGGVAAFMVAWGVAVNVWRHLAVAEVEAARRRLLAQQAAAAAAAAAAPEAEA